MLSDETNDPTSNAKKNTGFTKGDFMADEVLVTYFFQHDYYHQSSLKSNANVPPVAFWRCPDLGQFWNDKGLLA